MPLDITFTLSDQDLDHFQSIVDKAKSAMESDKNAQHIEEAATKLIEEARAAELPEFIAERLIKLQVVINMLGDTEGSSPRSRRRCSSAMRKLQNSS